MQFSRLLRLFLATSAIAQSASGEELAGITTTLTTLTVPVTVTASSIIEATTLTTQTASVAVEYVKTTAVVTVTATADVIIAPTAGAMALPTALVMTLYNHLDEQVVLSFRVGKDKNQKEFESAYGHPGVVALPTGQPAVYKFPPNWDGIVEVGYEPNIENSLIEGNTFGGEIDVDVSYVQGYSVPIVCSNDGRVVTGCNRQLFDYGVCPPSDIYGRACRNSARASNAASAAPFFTPCQSAAIIFPTDGGNFNGVPAAPRDITCCIGDEKVCPANAAQPRL